MVGLAGGADQSPPTGLIGPVSAVALRHDVGRRPHRAEPTRRRHVEAGAPPAGTAGGPAGLGTGAVTVQPGSMRILDPVLNDLTPRHLEIFWRYQVVRTGVDFGAATCFVVGSACFFFASLSTVADWLFLVGSEFVNTMTQRPTVAQLLPVEASHSTDLQDHWDYIYEPDSKEVLDQLMRRYIESLVFHGVLENKACEQSARMVAMKSATDNAKEIVNDLRITYNKARQAAITQELAEICAGASVAQ